MLKFLAFSSFAVLCSCGVSTYQAPPKGSGVATLRGELKDHLIKSDYYTVDAIDGKDVRSFITGSPIRVSSGDHAVTFMASHSGIGVPGAPLAGKVTTNVNFRNGANYTVRGRRTAEASEIWVEELPGGKRISPVLKAHLKTEPLRTPMIIFPPS